MNPITAIRQFLAPEIQPLPKGNRRTSEVIPIPLSEIESLPAPLRLEESSRPGAVTPSFGRVLGQLIEEVNGKQAVAGEAVRGVLGGQGVPLHRAIIAMEEASVSFQLMVEVRNKLLESYQELMRMQI